MSTTKSWKIGKTDIEKGVELCRVVEITMDGWLSRGSISKADDEDEDAFEPVSVSTHTNTSDREFDELSVFRVRRSALRRSGGRPQQKVNQASHPLRPLSLGCQEVTSRESLWA